MEDYAPLIAGVFIAIVITYAGLKLRASQKKEAAKKSRFARNAKKRAEAAKSVGKIRWGDQFVVDNGVIDRDHMTLFKLINEFNDGIPDFQSPDQMVPLLASLTNYTQTHFQREEKLQRISGFPFRDDHKQEHDALIDKFNGLKQKALRADENNVTDVAVEIGSFLREWLTGHVIESDLPLKPYVERMREQAKGMRELV